MMAPQVVGVLLKKPGQQSHPRFPPLDPQETKIRGEWCALFNRGCLASARMASILSRAGSFVSRLIGN